MQVKLFCSTSIPMIKIAFKCADTHVATDQMIYLRLMFSMQNAKRPHKRLYHIHFKSWYKPTNAINDKRSISTTGHWLSLIAFVSISAFQMYAYIVFDLLLRPSNVKALMWSERRIRRIKYRLESTYKVGIGRLISTPLPWSILDKTNATTSVYADMIASYNYTACTVVFIV